MTSELDPSEAVPTDNSLGAPTDEKQLDEATHPKGDEAQEALEKTPGPAD